MYLITSVIGALFICFVSSEELQSFSIHTDSHGCAPTVGENTVTVWFDQYVYQCAITPSSSDRDYSCDAATHFIGCDSSSDQIGAKMLIENNHADAAFYSSMSITTDLGTYTVSGICINDAESIGGFYPSWFGGDDTLCDAGYSHYTALAIDNEAAQFAPAKQLIYFDTTSINTDIETAAWGNGASLSYTVDESSCGALLALAGPFTVTRYQGDIGAVPMRNCMNFKFDLVMNEFCADSWTSVIHVGNDDSFTRQLNQRMISILMHPTAAPFAGKFHISATTTTTGNKWVNVVPTGGLSLGTVYSFDITYDQPGFSITINDELLYENAAWGYHCLPGETCHGVPVADEVPIQIGQDWYLDFDAEISNLLITDCDVDYIDLCADVDCDDGNLCTDEYCDESTGACVYSDVDCTDADACTIDSCDPEIGCVYNSGALLDLAGPFTPTRYSEAIGAVPMRNCMNYKFDLVINSFPTGGWHSVIHVGNDATGANQGRQRMPTILMIDDENFHICATTTSTMNPYRNVGPAAGLSLGTVYSFDITYDQPGFTVTVNDEVLYENAAWGNHCISGETCHGVPVADEVPIYIGQHGWYLELDATISNLLITDCDKCSAAASSGSFSVDLTEFTTKYNGELMVFLVAMNLMLLIILGICYCRSDSSKRYAPVQMYATTDDESMQLKQ